MNQINPYRQNFKVMQNFFSKPLILIIAIMFSASVVAEFATKLFNSVGNSISISIDVLDILAAIAFFLFYFKSKSNGPCVSYKAPIVILKVYAIISIVASGLVLLSSLFLTIFLQIVPSLNDETMLMLVDFLRYVMVPLLYYLVPKTLISLFFFISMLVLLNSIKKSTSTIYLYKKGSVVLGIFSIICMLCCIIEFFFLDSLLNNILSNMRHLATIYPFHYTEIQIDPLLRDFSYTINYANFAVGIVIYILLAIFAFSYNRYIKNLSVFINANYQNVQNTSEPNTEYSPANMWKPTEPKASPENFTPQHVFGNNPNNQQIPSAPNQVPTSSGANGTEPFNSAPNPNMNHSENPYAQNNPYSPNFVQSKVCPVCGNKCHSDSLFCGNCGNKF